MMLSVGAQPPRASSELQGSTAHARLGLELVSVHHQNLFTTSPPALPAPPALRSLGPYQLLRFEALILRLLSSPPLTLSRPRDAAAASSAMPPHLHPRSRMTTSLFTTTLMVSFLVVATPHILPCPVDPRARTDSAAPDALSGQPRRRRRRVPTEESYNVGMTEERHKMKDRDEWATPKRECPVPKPGGLIGQVLGLKKEQPEGAEEQLPIMKVVEKARRDARPGDGERTQT